MSNDRQIELLLQIAKSEGVDVPETTIWQGKANACQYNARRYAAEFGGEVVSGYLRSAPHIYDLHYVVRVGDSLLDPTQRRGGFQRHQLFYPLPDIAADDPGQIIDLTKITAGFD